MKRSLFWKLLPWIFVALVALLAIGAGAWTADDWLPWVRSRIAQAEPAAAPEHAEHDHAAEDHGGHDHAAAEHAGHDQATSLALSPQARRNIGLRTGRVALDDFQRSITVPGMVVERPGRTDVRVTAPLSGVITDVLAASGEVVHPGQTLFVMRLTHEDLVQAQTEFLKNLEAVDVENREIERLEKMTRGVVAGKVILEHRYQKQKLEGLLKAQREALLLHGLSEAQVDQIRRQRQLLRELRVVVPEVHQDPDEQHLRRHHASPIGPPAPGTLAGAEALGAARSPQAAGSPEAAGSGRPELLVLEELHVQNGDFVEAGTALATLQDLETLYIEGRAFEQDAAEVAAAARQDLPVTALVEGTAGDPEPIPGLPIVYLANQIETDSRALHFYVRLPNEMVRDMTTPAGQRFVTWRFKPGQRMRLRVPVETWTDQIVLPVEAIVSEGVETYVFVQNGSHFDRQPVHVRYRDQQYAVVANDGSIFPGDTVALNSAHQLQMALQNKAGGGVDPHAGHNH